MIKLVLPDDTDRRHVETAPKERKLAVKYGRVRVKKIRVSQSDHSVDERHVADIAESMLVHGQICPIVVRRVIEIQENGKESKKIDLISGAHRLQAAKNIESERIACIYIEGEEVDARLVAIGENLWRKDASVLQRAEMLMEWLTVASAKVNRSGQPVQKGKTGHLSGGVAIAARKLPLVGRSFGARRKIIERAFRIANLPSEVKKVAKAAGLENNQQLLLKIAKRPGRKAQVKLAKELGRRSNDPTEPHKQAASARSRHGDVMQNSGLESDGADAISVDDLAEKPPAASVVRETTFDDLEAFWKREGRGLWKYTPFVERERFIEMLRRTKCAAPINVVSFLQDVFHGRERVMKRELYALAKARGFAKRSLQQTLKAEGYSEKRKGTRSMAVWYFRNKDPDWKNQLKSISDSELREALKAQPEPFLTKAVDWPDPTERDYFADM